MDTRWDRSPEKKATVSDQFSSSIPLPLRVTDVLTKEPEDVHDAARRPRAALARTEAPEEVSSRYDRNWAGNDVSRSSMGEFDLVA